MHQNETLDMPPVAKTSFVKRLLRSTPRTSELNADKQPFKNGSVSLLVRNVKWSLKKKFGKFDKAYESRKIEKNMVRIPDMRKTLDHPIRDIETYRAAKNHTHPMCAAERTSITNFLCRIVKDDGRVPYVVSMSSQDVLNDEEGCRHFHWAKDLSVPYKNDKIRSNHVLIMTDVDYHVDMPRYLKLFKPILLYTLVPEFAGYRSAEYEYHFKDNKVHYAVSGGSSYEHELWDYKGDVITIKDDEGNLLCYHLSQHTIEKSPNHRIITILPYACVKPPYFENIPINELRRKTITKNGVSFVDSTLSNTVSLALEGNAEAISVDKHIYSAIKHRLSTKLSAAPTVGDVEQYLWDSSESKDIVKYKASILHKIFMTDFTPERNVVATTAIATQYVPVGPLVAIEVDSPCQILTTPLVSDPAVFPAKHINSEIASVKGRVEAPANNVRPPVKYNHYRDEFVNLVIPPKQRHQGKPLETDEVKLLQNKPQQKARTKQSEHLLGIFPKNRLESMVKGEAYASPNDPRVITTNSTALTIEMSRYTYAFKRDILKHFDWYDPCKTPERKHEIMKTLGDLGFVTSDFSRFDGSVSKYLQAMVKSIYMFWVNETDSACFKDNFEQVFIKRARTSSGYKYDPLDGTRSGSPITTDGNTMINAFISFCAFREIGMGPKEAWQSLGMYAGDDGLNRNIDGFPESLVLVSSQLGLKVEAVISPIDSPITYAGRTFPRPMTSNSSHQDIRRTLPKLHVSANKAVLRDLAAINRARGYEVTDGKTPLISAWCDVVFRVCGRREVDNSLTSEEHFKINNCAWPQEDQHLILESVAKIMGWTTAEVQEKHRSILASQNLDDIPIIWDNKTEPKIEAVKGDVIVRPHVNDMKCPKQQKPIKNNSMPHVTDGNVQCVLNLPRSSRNISTKLSSSKAREQKASIQVKAATLTRKSKPSAPASNTERRPLTRSQTREAPPVTTTQAEVHQAPPELKKRKRRMRKRVANAATDTIVDADTIQPAPTE
jgi:hypothetical protein